MGTGCRRGSRREICAVFRLVEQVLASGAPVG